MVRVGDAAFDSEFCRVEYRMADSVVFLAWKNFAAWGIIAGDPADVEWGFSFLLPEMAEASCQGVAFLMAEVSAIEE